MSAQLPLLVLRLRGSEAAMGAQHAELLRSAGGYEGVIDYYPRMPEMVLGGPRDGAGTPPLARALKPLVSASLRALESRRPAEQRARSRAFFEGLGVPASFSRYVSVMDVMQNLIGLAGRFGLGPSALLCRAAIPACSSLAVWGRASRDGRLRCARNFDFPGNGIWDRAPALVFCTPDQGLRYGFLTTRGGDVACVSAFNEAGLTLAAQTRFHRDGHLWRGVGIADLCHQIISRARTLEEAAAIACQRPPASTWGLTICSGAERSGVVVELTSRGSAVIRPLQGEDFLAQTNRYADSQLRVGQVAPATGFLENSDGRLRSARRWGKRAQAEGGIGALDLQRFLNCCEGEDAGCRAAGGVVSQGNTVHSAVLEPEDRSLWVSVGPVPTGGGPWLQVPWEWGASVSAEEVPTPSEAPRGPALDPARVAYVEVVRLESQGGARSDVAAAVARAVELAPTQPSYRLLAGGHALRAREWARALAHFEEGLRHETSPFHRAQLLLWGSRAAELCGERGRARELRGELVGLRGQEHVADFAAQAERENLRPLSGRRLRKVDPLAIFPDLILH